MSELVIVQAYLDKNEAQIAKGLLEENGIKSMISADDAGGYRPHLTFGMGGTKLLVEKSNLEKAKEVLNIIENYQEDEETKNFKIQQNIKSIPALYCIAIFLSLILAGSIAGIIFSPEGRPIFIMMAVMFTGIVSLLINNLRTIIKQKNKINKNL